MKTDARTRYTKAIIKSSFIKLLKEKPLAKVTVKAICELSEINRTTFYKYYKDAYDLLEKLEDEFLTELNQNVISSAPQNFREIFMLILVSIRANGDAYQTLFSENGDHHFPNKVFSVCYKSIASSTKKQFPHLSDCEQELAYYYIAYGCSGVIDRWISNGLETPIEEVATFAETLVLSTLKAF